MLNIASGGNAVAHENVKTTSSVKSHRCCIELVFVPRSSDIEEVSLQLYGQSMFNRHFLFILLLIAAVAGPALYYNVGWPTDWFNRNEFAQSQQIPARLSSFSLSPERLSAPVSLPVARINGANDLNPSQMAGVVSPPATPIPQTLILPGDANGPDLNAVPLEFMPITNLGEVFRFDVSPNWVKQRWDRTSVTSGDVGLTGMRVSLVTGVNATDLFGSLTYFFDARQTVQKITFQGWAGNPAGLVNFMTSAYGFKNQPTSAAGLYIAQSRNRSTGALFMQHPKVIRNSNPTQQVAIMLEINNPNGPYQLSQDVAATVFNNHR